MTEDVVDSQGAVGGEGDSEGKRVSWVELYFDLIFVFAVGQAAHVIVVQPNWRGLAIALGLFLPLWWTWIGFVVLYNRYSDEGRPGRRLFVLAGTLPCAVAAVEMHAAAEGHTVGFALALAGARVVLAAAFAVTLAPGAQAVARRAAAGYAVSLAFFAVSALVPGPWRYILWGSALVQEAGFLLLGRNSGRPRASGRRPAGSARPNRTESFRAMLTKPADPNVVVDAAHLAERFGLFMIILLGEIVVSVGAAALEVPAHGTPYWVGLLAGLVLAGALWWIYFDAAAPINEYVLRASGGNPTMAYGLYAGGHLSPAFSLLAIAAGVNLALHDSSPKAAAWLVCAGLAAYLIGTRAVVTAATLRFGRLLRIGVTAATVCFAFLEPVISAPGVVAVVAVWACALGAVVSWQRPGRLSRLVADPMSLFRSGES